LKSFHQIVLDEYFEPSIGKAVRVVLALILPLIWGMVTGHMGPAVWMAIAAQTLTTVTIRGAYPLKLLILSGAVVACAVCAALGTLMGNHWIMAVGLMMILAFLGGFVRQSGDHGPGITISVLLLYLLTLDHPGDSRTAAEMFLWVLEGGILALLSTLIAWAFVPFSPFRRSIALTWKALADWLEVFSLQFDKSGTEARENELDEKELSLRNELTNSMETLSRRQAIAHARQNRYSYHLVELRRVASEAGNAVSSLRIITDSACQNSRFPRKLFRYILENMRQAAHRMALSIITHRPEDIYTVRLSNERIKQSIDFFLKNATDESLSFTRTQMQQSLSDLVHCFDEALSILERSSGKSGKMTFFLQNFFTGITIPQHIPWVKFEFNSRSFTFRFSLRLALGMGIGIAVYKYFHIPHGYWIAMTTMIVLQPEFGATITKAFNRTKGTLLGATLGSLLFLIPLPLVVNMAVVAVCTFFMMYFIQRNYAIAAFFITVMVIALFHLLEPVTWQLGGIRVLNTLAGCGLAMLGGYAFWPLWERYRFPALIRQAIQANQVYMNVIFSALKEGKRKTFNDFIKPRREAEMTNNNAFLSLRRMESEPEQKQDNLQALFLILGHNIRVTRLLNALNQQIRAFSGNGFIFTDESFQEHIQHIFAQIEESFTEHASAAMKKTADTDKEIKKIQEMFAHHDIMGDTGADPATEVIVGLLERISKEAIGLYYAIRQLGSTDYQAMQKA
jgi:uncharacterized membrane protein YccC